MRTAWQKNVENRWSDSGGEVLRVASAYERVIRKVERIMNDMTEQLIANAESDEDIEVEVKLLFGKLVDISKNTLRAHKSIHKSRGPMRRITGSYDATVVAIEDPRSSPEAFSDSTLTTSESAQTPINQANEDKTAPRSTEQLEDSRTPRSSPSFDIVTFRGFLG